MLGGGEGEGHRLKRGGRVGKLSSGENAFFTFVAGFNGLC